MKDRTIDLQLMAFIHLTMFKFIHVRRFESTGIRPEYLRDALPLKQVQKKIQEFLCNGEQMWKIRPGGGGKARILVGHGLEDDLKRLQIDYPPIMIR